jgi:8-amino-7-oxononanoate synthase
VLAGDEAAAVALAEHFADQGILVQAIRPPSVPRDSARIRLTLNASFSDVELDRIIAALAGASL